MPNYNPFLSPIVKPGSGTSVPIMYFSDFVTGVTEDGSHFSTTADKGDWLTSQDTLDGVGVTFVVQDDQDGGVVRAKTDATGGERISAQINGESFFLEKGRRLYFECRMKVTTVTADMFLGIAVNTTDPHATAPADYIAFGLTGDADLEVGTATGGSDAGAFSGTDSGSDLTANTWTVLAFEYDGADTVRFYKDGSSIYTTATNVPFGKYMSPVMCIESNGASEELFVDYILVSNDRPT